MITEVILPKLGQTMETGVIVDWLKEEGDPVGRGDALFTVESDKAVLEVEATARGFLRRMLVPAGQTVPVLTVVGLITRELNEDISAYEPGRPASGPVPGKDAAALIPGPVQTQDLAPAGRIFASPRARKAARQQGVDLAQVRGTGPNGRIVEQDVLEYLAAQAGAPQPRITPVARRTAEAMGVDLAELSGTGPGGRIVKADVVSAAGEPELTTGTPVAAQLPATTSPASSEPMTGMRRIIADRMAASHAATARVTLVTEADATVFVEVRERLKASVSEEWGFAPGYNDLLGLVVARALSEYRYMNARLSPDGSSIERLSAVNLGMAVDTERGLLVPVIHDADQKGLQAFATEFRTLVERARASRSMPDDLSGGTFTITNLGMYEIDAFTPIINLPEAAILGVGRIQPKAVVRDGEIVARQMWTLSLTFDHRLVDGAPAARFLQRIKQLIENPYLLLA